MLCRYIFVCALLVTSAAVFLGRNYGSYTTKVLSLELKNYKPFVRITVVEQQQLSGSSSLTFAGNVSKDLGVIGIKVTWFIWNESLKKFSQAINVAMRNICEKPFAKELLGMIPRLGKDCKVKSGIYNVTLSDFNGFMHTLTNGKFIYGTYMMVTDVFTTKYGRILKMNMTLSFEPV